MYSNDIKLYFISSQALENNAIMNSLSTYTLKGGILVDVHNSFKKITIIS